MRNAAEFPAPPRSSMRAPVVAVLIAVLLSMTACAQSRGKMLLTDTQMDAIKAGTDLCVLFDSNLSSPCVGSFLQVFDPMLGSPGNPFTAKVGVPLPPSGKVKVDQSFVIDGFGTSQSAFQSNSVSVQQNFRSSCITCWQPMDLSRFPGH